MTNEEEVWMNKLVACGVGAMANTPNTIAEQRLPKDHIYWSASLGDVYAAVDREMVHRANEEFLIETLEKLARLGNGDQYGNSDGNVIAQQALAKVRASKVSP